MTTRNFKTTISPRLEKIINRLHKEYGMFRIEAEDLVLDIVDGKIDHLVFVDDDEKKL